MMGNIFDAVVEPVVDHAMMENARLRNAVRARLLVSGTALDLEGFAEATQRDVPTARRWVERKRKSGRLVAITHKGKLYIPTIQLDPDQDLGLDVAATSIVSELCAAGMDGWAVWTWLETSNAWLNDKTPSSLLRQGDLRSVRAAVDGLLQR